MYSPIVAVRNRDYQCTRSTLYTLVTLFIIRICTLYTLHTYALSSIYTSCGLVTVCTVCILSTLCTLCIYLCKDMRMFSGVTTPTASELKPNERPQQPSLHDLPSNVDRARPHQTLVRDRLLHSYDSSMQLTRSHSIILDG